MHCRMFSGNAGLSHWLSAAPSPQIVKTKNVFSVKYWPGECKLPPLLPMSSGNGTVIIFITNDMKNSLWVFYAHMLMKPICK